MKTVGIAMICKAPAPGKSKTRLSPPLTPQQCAELSSCFIRDLSQTIAAVCKSVGGQAYASYTPVGAEAQLQALLPQSFRLIAQCEGDFGDRLRNAVEQVLADGHAGAIIVSADSPTMPASLFEAAARAIVQEDCVALSPALDGGYTLIGLSRAHARLFENINWSTSTVFAETLDRARDIDLPVVDVGLWYDVDEAETLTILQSELEGGGVPFQANGRDDVSAPATQAYLNALALKPSGNLTTR